MPPERSKRVASTSPLDLKRDAKRLRLASDLWSNVEHQQQDEVIKRRLLGKGDKPRKYDVNSEFPMAVVLKLVGDVASEGKHSHLFHVPPAIEHIAALEEDRELLRVVGEAYTSGSYKVVRCLSESFMLCQLTALISVYQSSSAGVPFRHFQITLTQHLGRRRVREDCNVLFVCLWSNFSCRTVLGAEVFRGGGTSPMEPHFRTLQPPA